MHNMWFAQNSGQLVPLLYYRDVHDPQYSDSHQMHKIFTESTTTTGSDDTATTKSTVRTTVNLHNLNRMFESTTSKETANTQSYHIEQVVTDRLVLSNPRTLLTLCLIAFGSSIQLLIFSLICLVYDGCPHFIAIISSVLFIFNSLLQLYFIRYKSTRMLLVSCTVLTCVCFVVCVSLFIWTAYLIYEEDRQIRKQGWSFYRQNLMEANKIVTNTRLAMYSLHMIILPIQALCCIGIFWILQKSLKLLQGETVTKGYFFAKPFIGNQVLLIPIELKQVNAIEESEPDDVSVGVQTSGNHSYRDTINN
uniref:G-protein coupled receptors family 1 profile domain-containing protein n=1 Tax=Syphacia muris TaxID=451379 RepID=A0A0N5ALH9_9BILA